MDETKIQNQYVVKFFCRSEKEGGLGYRETAKNIVSKDLFIPSVLAEFVQSADPAMWNRLLQKYNGDEMKLQAELKNAVKERLLEKQNVAIAINKNKTITFKGETVPLYFVSGTELKGDEDFEKNIFSVVEESTHTIKCGENNKLYTVRPDLTFFLNGIYIGYLELKITSNNQSAQKEGRGKIIKDYLSTVQNFANCEKTIPSVSTEKKKVMSIFEKAIHLVTSDINETYVLRGVSSFYDSIHQELSQDIPAQFESLAPDILKQFKEYPVLPSIKKQTEKFESVMRALYSKKMIEKEILYYNLIAYKYKKDKNGKVRTSNTGTLITPRPKQKFGCDKIMMRIKEMLDHESDPNYYINKLRDELHTLGITAKKTEEIIAKRLKFCNNMYVYSLLMQYAAGFGKSNIIGWTALQLKDYRYNGEYAFDKIMLVVDRLQLRDQLDTTMRNMNIDKSMFIEATDQETFIKALDSNRRIIVVNIQKFLELQKALDHADKKLQKMRVAFLIDEIHRSNSGDNNKEMINIFEKIQDSFNKHGREYIKKNLLIGFTATPNDETLVRFGEFRSANIVPLWVPFDYYSMKEAIADGYILDPTKHIIPYNVPVKFELPKELEDKDEAEIRENKQKIYEFEPRMRKIAEFLVDRLVTLIYGKIKGTGKAMLAVSSIPVAIKYFHIIKQMYEEKCKDKKYVKFKDAPIVIIYSDSQSHQACSTLNGGVSETKAIENFKNQKNGLIIVVDKLQTGFDEQKLHTLFLDKEISDINAIQTISRVNRKCKYKEECHIIDFSWKHVNVKNIKLAFKKYCDMVVSTFNPEEEMRNIAKLYKQLLMSEVSTKWYNLFKGQRDDAEFILNMEGDIREWIKNCFSNAEQIRLYNQERDLHPGDEGYKEEINPAKLLRFEVGQYASTLRMLKNIVDYDAKYEDEIFLDFWHKFCNIYKDATKTEDGKSYEYEVVDSDELPGITMEDEDPEEQHKGHHRPGIPKDKKKKLKTIEEIIQILKNKNEEEEMSAQQAQVWLKEIGLMYQEFSQDEKLCAFLKDDQFSEDEKLEQYHKAQNRYGRKVKNRGDFPNVDVFRKLLTDNEGQLFAAFIDNLVKSDETAGDFDFDVTGADDSKDNNSEFDEEALIKKVKELLKPSYDEDKLKEYLLSEFESRFERLKSILPPFKDSVNTLFKVLNTESLPSLDGIDTLLKESLNTQCRSVHLSVNDKRMNLNILVQKFEVYLKKLYYLINKKEIVGQEGKRATLSNAIFAFDCLKELKYSREPELQEIKEKLGWLRKLRNEESHNGQLIDEQQLDLLIPMCIDMYIYVTANCVNKLKKANV